ncbi:hypothetical protein MCG98_18715 [Ruminococcus sp. OA3]|uniref:hypothetical protein n=1 Tax=Ruminococcus sp. OA3 TaxID=2914164 RepID=UPI001F070BF2|nr:hypothetical protein [Ruminococcus sp. OA3]MCH1984578.1 hypothetical protein [Ruminococcus sp. OA3]MCH1984591.1 hypothetical protein [Ruminococcus sp. OA3]
MSKQNLVRDPTKERAELFVSLAKYYMDLHNKKNSDVAKAIGVSDQVLYKRRQSPRNFKLSETLKIMDYLKFSEADRARVVGVKVKIYAMGGKDD